MITTVLKHPLQLQGCRSHPVHWTCYMSFSSSSVNSYILLISIQLTAVFQSHIPASLLIDFQALYPSSVIPNFISALPKLYVEMSKDPLIGGAMGFFGNSGELGWFKSFLVLELWVLARCIYWFVSSCRRVFQFPVFFLGIRGLWNGKRICTLII